MGIISSDSPGPAPLQVFLFASLPCLLLRHPHPSIAHALRFILSHNSTRSSPTYATKCNRQCNRWFHPLRHVVSPTTTFFRLPSISWMVLLRLRSPLLRLKLIRHLHPQPVLFLKTTCRSHLPSLRHRLLLRRCLKTC